MPRLLSSTETVENSVLSDCTSLRSFQGAHHLLYWWCCTGHRHAVGVLQGSRCDLVCSSGACDVSCSKKRVCCSCSCVLCLYQCLGPPTSLQPVTQCLQCRHLNMQPPEHHHQFVFSICVWPLPLDLFCESE